MTNAKNLHNFMLSRAEPWRDRCIKNAYHEGSLTFMPRDPGKWFHRWHQWYEVSFCHMRLVYGAPRTLLPMIASKVRCGMFTLSLEIVRRRRGKQ